MDIDQDYTLQASDNKLGSHTKGLGGVSSLEACWRLCELQACMSNRQSCCLGFWPQRKALLNAFNTSNQIGISVQPSLLCLSSWTEAPIL